MKHRSYFSETSTILPIATGALATGIFILDTITDSDLAVEVFYVAVVLMSVSFCRRRGVILVAVGCMALTILSGLVSPPVTNIGLINSVISLSVIAVTTYLVLQIRSAETAVHEARAQLAHVARAVSLGELVASIAHEVNQPLAAIVINGKACLRWLAGRPPNLKEARQAVEQAVEDANRASEVIGRVRNLAKRAPAKEDWLSINETIIETTALVASEIQKNRIALRTRLSNDLPLIFGDRIQLQQLILNLTLNAIEAISAVAEGPRELVVSSAKDGSKVVLITIQDSGHGLEPGNVDHLFDAFYTTKLNGMGMGLAIGRSIIEAHGGRLWATPNTPRGAVFQFTLPLDRAEAS